MTDIEKQGHAESADSLKGRKGCRLKLPVAFQRLLPLFLKLTQRLIARFPRYRHSI